MHFCFGDCELDTERYELRRAGQVVALEPKAFKVLAYLVQQHGRAVAKRDLLAAFWPGATVDNYTEYALRNCLLKIRQAVGDAQRPASVIETVRGYGYRFVAPVTALALAPDASGMSPQVSSTSDRAPTPAVRPPRLPEHRHLTVLRCGLVPTAWLQRQDPEVFQRLVQVFYQACEETIVPFAGYIAQYDSDEILIYFGYPVAYEDAALRAVRAGLALVAAVPRLALSGERAATGPLAVRLSIHTGRVVVDALGDAGHGGPTVAGGMVSEAKQLHAQTLPQTVLLSAETYRLVQGYVVCEAYETPHALGDDAPLTLYRVLRESGAQSRFAVALARGLTRLVGRTAEVAVLQERWVQVQEGMGQVVLVSGEPGIGKSRLVQELKEQVASEAHTRLECHCSPYHTTSAWYPVIDLLQRVLGWQDLGTPADRLNVLEHFLQPLHSPLADTVPLLAALLSLSLPDGRYPPLTFSPQQQRQRTVALLQALVLGLAECQPVLLLVEDLHWVDPSTLEFLSFLVEQVPTARCLLVLTARPEFSSPWGVRAHVTTLTVSRLRPSQVTVLAQQVAGAHRLPAAVCQQIVTQTDGVPLFVEELTKTVLESGVLRTDQEAAAHAGPLSAVAIPPTLQDALMARLDRLAMGKMVAQLGATIGRTFAYALLQAVSPLDEGILQQELTRLVGAELLYQRGIPPQATYTFKHALIQDAAYQSLLWSTRQQYHQRIAQVLEVEFPETASTQPELLAQHLMEAGLHEQAVSYWYKAGQRASQHSALAEAIAHFRQGVEVLTTLPDTPERAQRELDLLIPLGATLGAAKGWAIPERGRVFNRARELCQRVGDTQRLIPVLNGLVSFHAISGRQRQAYELAEEMYALAQSLQNPVLLIRAQSMLGSNVFYHGRLELARTHLEQAIARHDAQQGHATLLNSSWGSNRGLYARGYLIWVLSVLGYLDQALQHSREALGLARDFARPYNLAHVLTFVMRAYQSRRELQATQECTQEIIALCTEYAFAYLLGCGIVLEGWARAMQGEAAQGIVRMHQGLEAIRATETQGNLPYFLTLLAEAYARHAQAREGLVVVDDALRLVHNSGERCYEAELYRLKGVLRLTLSLDHHAEAEACFRRALDIARHQHAKALELRVAVSLSQLWQQHGKREAARALLAPVYGWFTEGFDTADLQEAKALLDTLA